MTDWPVQFDRVPRWLCESPVTDGAIRVWCGLHALCLQSGGDVVVVTHQDLATGPPKRSVRFIQDRLRELMLVGAIDTRNTGRGVEVRMYPDRHGGADQTSTVTPTRTAHSRRPERRRGAGLPLARGEEFPETENTGFPETREKPEREARARDPRERLEEDARIMAGATVPSDHRSTVADGIGNAGEGNGVESLADRLIAATRKLLRPGERSAVNASPAELVTRRLSERLGGFDLPPEQIAHALVWASRSVPDAWLQARALNWQALSGGKRGDVDVLDQVLLQWRQAGCPQERDDTAPQLEPEAIGASPIRNGNGNRNSALAGLIARIGHGRPDA